MLKDVELQPLYKSNFYLTGQWNQRSSLLRSYIVQFMSHGTNSQWTNFDHIVSSLTLERAIEVQELILQPPDDTAYDKLKE